MPSMSVTPFEGAARFPEPKIQGVSLWQSARRRLVRNRAAMGGLIALVIVALLAIFGPLLSTHAYDDVFWDMPFSSPPDFGNGFYFGIDANGRDLFVRTMYGARISLMVGVLASMVSLLIGVIYGATAGYLGGHADNIMMRIVDIMYSLPFMFFVILLTVFFGRDIFLIFVAIGAVEWLDMARIVRGQTMALKHREFILLESFLSFLGLGVQEPMTSWGVLIADGARTMESAPNLLLFPATFLAVTLFSLNFLGDGLRDALDPKDR
jgi:oligopeptide transport system permease protein